MWALLAIFLLAAPFESAASERLSESNPETLPSVREVRVLLASHVKRVKLGADGPLVGEDAKGDALPPLSSIEGIEVSCGLDRRIRVDGYLLATSSLTIRSRDQSPLTLAIAGRKKQSTPDRYLGELRIESRDERGCEIINIVDVETYVAGVVAREIWPTFEPVAYRVQAIAARTFVLYQMQRRNGARYDVVATQGAQVYRGVRDDIVGKRAAEAVDATRGLALTRGDGKSERLFATFYSSVCGGMSQSAGIFSKTDDVEPLRGGVSCDYCNIAPGDAYRWGPVSLPLREVQKKLVKTYPKLKSLGAIRSVKVVETAGTGRALRVRITGARDEPVELLAERFRLALGGSRIRSTVFTLRVRGGQLVFEDGRGFGHGLGLCQWGMQGQALQGRSVGEILRYYYPSSNLTRVY